MANRSDITPELCRQLLRYEPNTGKLFWLAAGTIRIPQFYAKYGGKEAFTYACFGYRTGRIRGLLMQAHRVAWAMVHDIWPDGEIDHINGIRDDNRLANLRLVDKSGNMRNTAMSPRNRSGVVGVAWDTKRGKWQAYIKADKKIALGRFNTFEEAVEARHAAEQRLGYHPNHGRHARLPRPT